MMSMYVGVNLKPRTLEDYFMLPFSCTFVILSSTIVNSDPYLSPRLLRLTANTLILPPDAQINSLELGDSNT